MGLSGAPQDQPGSPPGCMLLLALLQRAQAVADDVAGGGVFAFSREAFDHFSEGMGQVKRTGMDRSKGAAGNPSFPYQDGLFVRGQPAAQPLPCVPPRRPAGSAV
jgi:hypothetical protein